MPSQKNIDAKQKKQKKLDEEEKRLQEKQKNLIAKKLKVLNPKQPTENSFIEENFEGLGTFLRDFATAQLNGDDARVALLYPFLLDCTQEAGLNDPNEFVSKYNEMDEKRAKKIVKKSNKKNK